MINGKEIYKGEWEGDQICGRGVIRNLPYASRRKLSEDSVLRFMSYEGEFRNNMFQGEGLITLSNGVKVEGYFENNIPQFELL